MQSFEIFLRIFSTLKYGRYYTCFINIDIKVLISIILCHKAFQGLKAFGLFLPHYSKFLIDLCFSHISLYVHSVVSFDMFSIVFKNWLLFGCWFWYPTLLPLTVISTLEASVSSFRK